MDTTSTIWLPAQSSTFAQNVDSLFYFLLYLSIFFFLLIVGLIIAFAVKYRRKEDGPAHGSGPTHNTALEMSWIIIPILIVAVIFVWGFKGFMQMSVAPSDALEIKITAQKWFWAFTYPDGTEATNELVVPVNRPIKLLMSSQDVIHSFFVPAFRIKRDVLPNRYTVIWFEATNEGNFDLYCAEYCGTKHSEMLGKVKVVSGAEFNKWLEEASTVGEGIPPAEFGSKLYRSKACYTCHSIDGTPGIGPSLLGIYGHDVRLVDGSVVSADENYIRESILVPTAKVVAGYQPVMPTYQGRLRPIELDGLIAYIKSLGGDGEEH